MENQYEKMSLTNLKELAKEKGIKNISAIRKQELINILSNLKLTEEQETIENKKNNIDHKEVAHHRGFENKVENKVQNNLESKPENKSETKMENKVENQAETNSTIESDPTIDMSLESKLNLTNVDISNTDYRKSEGSMVQKRQTNYIPTDMEQLNSGETKEGILEVMPDGLWIYSM